jgi:tetratricopeptide (TPR) repeat protein
MTASKIDPQAFISTIEPLLESQDLKGIHALLKSRWTCEQLEQLLVSSHTDAKKVAILALGLVGKRCCVDDLASALKDADPVVHQLAEHALWSVWFRCGTSEARAELLRGTQSMNNRDFDSAHHHFDLSIQLDPAFAEAYNQRAIAFYLQEEYSKSIADCRRTVMRMPVHFGAWAGMGHCQAHANQIEDAIDSYRKALAINPRLECVQMAIDELSRRLEQCA